MIPRERKPLALVLTRSWYGRTVNHPLSPYNYLYKISAEYLYISADYYIRYQLIIMKLKPLVLMMTRSTISWYGRTVNHRVCQ